MVANVNVAAVGDQGLNDLEVAFLRGDVEGAPPAVVLGLEERASRGQLVHHLRTGQPRRIAAKHLRESGDGLRAEAEEEAGGAEGDFGGQRLEHGFALVVARLDVHPVIEQHVHDADVPVLERNVPRALAALGACVDVESVVEQVRDSLGQPVPYCYVQRSPA